MNWFKNPWAAENSPWQPEKTGWWPKVALEGENENANLASTMQSTKTIKFYWTNNTQPIAGAKKTAISNAKCKTFVDIGMNILSKNGLGGK